VPHHVRVASCNFAESVAGQPNGAFFEMAPWAEKNTATLKKFRTAVHSATQYLIAHSDESKKLTAKFTGLHPALVSRLIPSHWSDRVVRSDWEKTMQLMGRYHLISSKITFGDMVPPSAMSADQ
jgi:ABC-type nitrate/sulfonate/bicarbonate transport system substrate-binding protein